MKVSDSQKEIIKTLVYDIITSDPINYHGVALDPDYAIDVAINGALDFYSNVMDNDELTVTELHAVIIACIAKLVTESIILNTKIQILEKQQN